MRWRAFKCYVYLWFPIYFISPVQYRTPSFMNYLQLTTPIIAGDEAVVVDLSNPDEVTHDPSVYAGPT